MHTKMQLYGTNIIQRNLEERKTIFELAQRVMMLQQSQKENAHCHG
jgi:hypothetical protein